MKGWTLDYVQSLPVEVYAVVVEELNRQVEHDDDDHGDEGEY